MTASRRAFLRIAGVTVGASLLGTRALLAAGPGAPVRYASCVRIADDAYGVAVLDEAGRILQLRPLPGRGHDVAFDPVSGRCVAFARRPGTFAVVFDAAGREEPTLLAAAPGRHFYGHGVFTADGGTLYATENDIEAGRGLVGVYDARDGFRRIGEVPTGGVGPHELVWAADRRSLVVANGGLDTAGGEFGRSDLNRAEMVSTLSVIDPDGGRLLHRAVLPSEHATLSIRHLAVDHAGAVWFGCQHEGDPTDLPPLAGRLSPGGEPELFALPEEIRTRPKNYVGSVAVSADGGVVAFSAPKGGILFAFDTATAGFLGAADLDDGCGLAPAPEGDGGLYATAGTGRIIRLHDDDLFAAEPVARADVAFDNHLLRLG